MVERRLNAVHDAVEASIATVGVLTPIHGSQETTSGDDGISRTEIVKHETDDTALVGSRGRGAVCRLETGGDGDACRRRCLIPASGSRVAQDGFAL